MLYECWSGSSHSALPGVRQPRHHSGDKISESDDQQGGRMPFDNDADDDDKKHQQASRLARVHVDFFTAPEAPTAHHEEPCERDERQPDERHPEIVNGRSRLEVDDRCEHSCSSGDRHSNEILAVWTAGIARLRVDGDIETRQPAGAADEEQKTYDEAKVHGARFDLGMAGWRELPHSPQVGQEAWRNAKASALLRP